jgi:hypothetical protein
MCFDLCRPNKILFSQNLLATPGPADEFELFLGGMGGNRVTKGDGKIYSKPSSGKTSFSPQNALKRLAAGLRPDPLGEL